MRPIHLVRLDKTRPALILTREIVLPYLTWVSVAPITSSVKGLTSELPVGIPNGLDGACAVSLDNITTVEKSAIGRRIGYLMPTDEPGLTAAILAAFDLNHLPDREQRLYSNPQLLEQIEHSMEHPETWVERGRLKRKNTE
jgi:mRNA interferase MazF